MRNFITGIVATTGIVLCQSQIVWSQSIEEIQNIAEKITVKIETPFNNGSGVIIGKKGTTYYVLTARHVINDVKAGEFLQVQTHDRQSYKIDVNKRKDISNGIDLSLVQFQSDRNYPVAKISTFNYQLYKDRDYTNKDFVDASEKQHIFVSGWPMEIEERIFSAGYLYDNFGGSKSYQPDVIYR